MPTQSLSERVEQVEQTQMALTALQLNLGQSKLLAVVAVVVMPVQILSSQVD
jgi:hypothetical protein